jgi:hypothetical protein
MKTTTKIASLWMSTVGTLVHLFAIDDSAERPVDRSRRCSSSTCHRHASSSRLGLGRQGRPALCHQFRTGALAVVVLLAACTEKREPAPPPQAPPTGPSSARTNPATECTGENPSGVCAPPSVARVGDPNDWCGGHGIPESMCTKCSPSLIAGFQKSGDWCGAHGFPESACPLCNPMQVPSARTGSGGTQAIEGCAKSPGDWCEGHQVPESLCTRCNTSLIPAFKATGDWCQKHALPESQCRVCNPGLVIQRSKHVERE